MSNTTFTNLVTLTDADWFNDVNDTVYDILGDGTNPPTTTTEARTNLAINDLTEDTSPDKAADYMETWDTSTGLAKKVLLNNFTVTQGTLTSATGTAINFTGLPAGLKRIVISFSGVSSNGTSQMIIQLGDSGGIETSGYLGASAALTNAASISCANFTDGFGIYGASAANVIHGTMTLTLMDATTNLWASSSSYGFSATNVTVGGGAKALSGTLDRVRITTQNGTDAYDAGSISIQYE